MSKLAHSNQETMDQIEAQARLRRGESIPAAPERYVAKRYLLCDPRASTMTDGHRHMQESEVGNWVEAKDYDALNQYVLHLMYYMKDPSKSMVDAGMEVIDNRDAHQTFTAMSSTLIRGEQ